MASPLRRRRAARVPPAPVATGPHLAASAQRFNLKKKDTVAKQRRPPKTWQADAWEHFDEVPELKYSVWYMGNVMAKVRLFVAVANPDDPDGDPVPASDPSSGLPAGVAQRAQVELERLHGELGGRAEITRAMNMNLEVTGEGYIVGFGPREIVQLDAVTGNPTGVIEVTDEEWGVYSISQVTEKGGEYTVQLDADGKERRKLDPNIDELIRIYQRHPRWSLEADCNMRGVLGECEALVLLSNSIKADAKSRMSAGWLLIPNELSGGGDVETEPEDGEEAPVDPFLQELYDGAIDPVEDPSSAAAVAPTFVRGPAEALKEFRHEVMQRIGDPMVLEKIQAAIERVARGLNLPVEVVMGHQQTTFANALQVSKDTFNDHFQPRCVLICDALTAGFMQPNLIDGGMDPDVAARVMIWFDPSAMIAQANPVDSADKGIELGLISREAWRRAGNWTEDDAPDPEEQLVLAVMKLGTFDPAITTAILDLLGVPLDVQEPAPAAPFAAAAGIQKLLAAAIMSKYSPREQGARRTLDQILVDVLNAERGIEPALRAAASVAAKRRNPGYDLMLLDRELRARLLTAADRTLTRALEKAGNKLRSKSRTVRELAIGGKVHSVYVAATLGPSLVASAGFTDDELIPGDTWDGLESQFRTWVADAQQRALAIIGNVVTVTAGQRATATAKQATDLDAAWSWLRDELHDLAAARLYSPDPIEPDIGEHDPTGKVPVGLVRQALARAGGATGLTEVTPTKGALRAAPGGDAAGTPIYVAVNNGEPLGGVGLGEVISSMLSDGGAGTEGYEWVYGPAYRIHPFEEHETLDGELFQSFDSDVLAAGDWIGDYYFPGDHDGCSCDFAPIIAEPGAFEDSATASAITDLGPAPDESDMIDEADSGGQTGRTAKK